MKRNMPNRITVIGMTYIKYTFFVVLFIMLFTSIAYADGILNNNTYGVSIDIYSAPYSTTYATIGNNEIGTGVVYGPYGCGWFASARISELTGKPVPLYNGVGWWNNAMNEGFSRGTTAPTSGKAVICYKNEVSDDGVQFAHVEIIEGFSGGDVIISTGGYTPAPNNGYCAILKKNASSYLSQSKIQGFVYLDTWLPTPGISDNKNYVNVGESIVFWYSGLTNCSKAQFYFEKSGKLYYTKDSTYSTTFSTYFENEGVYNIYSGGYYNGQWYYSPKITVYVFQPQLTSTTNNIKAGQNITFTYSGLTNCDKVEICFEKNGAVYYAADSTKSRSFTTYFERPGEYKVFARGHKNEYVTTSEKIKVSVSCDHSLVKTPAKVATALTEGNIEYWTCSGCSKFFKDSAGKQEITKAETIIPKLEKQTESDGSSSGTNTTLSGIAALDSMAQSIRENDDPSGSSFSLFQLKSMKVKKTSIKIGWKAVPNAARYVVYGAPCGSKYGKLTEIKGTSYTQSKLKKGKYYKYFISAYDKNGNILASSKTIHIATSGGKKGNTKEVKLNSKKKTLMVGKMFQLKAKLKNGSEKVSKHRNVAYESSNPKVAAVTKSGKIKAFSKGTCYIYVYAQNGVFAKCKITVK